MTHSTHAAAARCHGYMNSSRILGSNMNPKHRKKQNPTTHKPRSSSAKVILGVSTRRRDARNASMLRPPTHQNAIPITGQLIARHNIGSIAFGTAALLARPRNIQGKFKSAGTESRVSSALTARCSDGESGTVIFGWSCGCSTPGCAAGNLAECNWRKENPRRATRKLRRLSIRRLAEITGKE
jgi:hypothetical protein